MLVQTAFLLLFSIACGDPQGIPVLGGTASRTATSSDPDQEEDRAALLERARLASADRARELLEKAIRRQLRDVPEANPIRSFLAQIQLVDQRASSNRQVTINLDFEADEKLPARDRIRTCVREGNYITLSHDGKGGFWMTDRVNKQRRELTEAEFDKDKRELRRQARLSRFLTQIFSLSGLRESLEELSLEGESRPETPLLVTGMDGKPVAMAFVLRATSTRIGRLLESGDTPASTPPWKPSKPEDEPRAEMLLYFDLSPRLVRIELRQLGVPEQKAAWQSYTFPAIKPYLVEDSGQRVLGPAAFRLYHGRAHKGEALQPALIARINHFMLNHRFRPGHFEQRFEQR